MTETLHTVQRVTSVNHEVLNKTKRRNNIDTHS